MTRWIITPQDRNKFHSFVPEESDFLVNKLHYLTEEGLGLHGSFSLKGHIVVRGSNLFVSAMGHTPPMLLPEYKGAFEFFAAAKLVAAGREIAHRKLSIGKKEVWPNEEYTAIGSAMFCIPPTINSTEYAIRIEGGYWFTSGLNHSASALAKTSIQIRGVRL